MQAPVLIKPIPAQVVNERAAYGPFNLREYLQVPEGGEPALFSAELKDGQALPTGMICTSDGILTGIPGKGTEGNYEIIVTATNDVGSIQANFILTIKPSLLAKETDYIDKLKAQVWEAVAQHLPIPDLPEMYNQPITLFEIAYLLERWGIIIIWDAFNLEPPTEKQLLDLEGVSEHYNVYDRGCCIVGCPKDLFSYERTLEDGLKTARAMAREVYKRDWTVELTGVAKLTRAAWIEIQHLGDKHGKRLEVINFEPTPDDVDLYRAQALDMGMGD